MSNVKINSLYAPTDTLEYNDNLGSVDAAGRLRVATSETHFEAEFPYKISTLQWYTEVSGSGSSIVHVPNESAAQLTVGTGSTHYSMMRSKRYFSLPLDRSSLVTVSFNFSGSVANVNKRVGPYDDREGIFLEQNGNGKIYIVRRTTTSGTTVEAERIIQSSWNIDKMDGTGPSGRIKDFSTIQTVLFNFVWPSGRIRVGFRLNEVNVFVHSFKISDRLTVPGIGKPHVPIRAEIFNVGTSVGDNTFRLNAANFTVGGGQFFRNFNFATGSGAMVSTTARRPIMSIRPNTTFNGVTNRGFILLNSVDLSIGTNPCYWEIVYSGSLTGANFNTVNLEHSFAQYDTGSTAISGGIVIESGFGSVGQGSTRASTNAAIDNNYFINVPDRSGSIPTNISLVVTGIGGATNVAAAINWDEIR